MRATPTGRRLGAVLAALLAGVGLAACDAWPTDVINETAGPVTFRYRHESYGSTWSTPLTLAPCRVVTLDREHWITEFTGVEFTDGGRTYNLVGLDMEDLAAACPHGLLGGTSQCEISYHGQGRISAKPVRYPTPTPRDPQGDREKACVADVAARR
jgi:hypothetical protein